MKQIQTLKSIVGGIPSPNPDFPQQIKNVTGNNNVKIQNKNLFDLSKCTVKNGTLNSDNSITSNIIDGYYTQINTTSLNNYLLEHKGKSITFSIDKVLNNKSISIVIYGQRESSTYQDVTVSNSKTVTLTIANDFTLIDNLELRVNRSNTKFTDTTTTVSEIMLEEGSTATDYVEHQEQNLPFTFAEGQRGMQGTTLQDDGIHNKWYEESLINRNWSKYTNTDSQGNTFGFFMNLSKIPKRDITATNFAKCNILIQKQRTKVATSDEEGFYLGDGTNALFIKIKQSLIPNGTIEELQTLLTNTNAKIQYETTEEEIIPYNETQQAQYNAIKKAQGYNDQTNISQTNDNLPFILDIEALKNN